MKSVSISLIIICFVNITLTMELSQLKPDIKKQVKDAFAAFGISADDNCSIDTVTQFGNESGENMHRWAGGPQCVHLTQDIQQNPYLTEFAAHCIAASNKNGHHNKRLFLYHTSVGISMIIASFIFAHMFINATEANLISFGATIASSIPMIYIMTAKKFPRMLENTIDHYFDAIAFTQACQKLIEQSNLKPLATYYAFAKLIKHRPLSQESQTSTIKWALQNSNHSITCSLTSTHSARASIWKAGKCIVSGEYNAPGSDSKEVSLADFNTSDKISVSWINA